MGDTIFTDIFTTVIVTTNYVRLVTRAFINYFKIQICHAIGGNLRSGDVFFGRGKKIPLQTKKNRLIAGNGKNE